MKRPLLFIFVFVVLALLFTRLFAIKDGLFFFNDYGRDMFVLHQWRDSWKPPLLGPQNSALPFNQPAMYFYWLMPLYVLSGFSAFANVYTLVATSLACLFLGMYLVRKKREWWPIILAYAWLVVIHPQHIIQNRFVWNPSFIPALLGFALLSFVYLRQNWGRKALLVFAMSLALAVSFSYAIVPVLFVLGLLTLWWWRKDWKRMLSIYGSLVASLLFFQLPTLAFEAKYRFQLTRAVLFGERPAQAGIDVMTKLQNLGTHIVGGEVFWQIIFVLGFAALLFINIWQSRRSSQEPKDRIFRTMLPLFLGTVALTLILPIAVHSHYIFGLTTLAFLLIASLRPKLMLVALVGATVYWLQPHFTQAIFEPARRTVADLESCAQLVCNQEKQPLFVATESRHHTFHNGPEFRYALAHAGCNVEVIEQSPEAAQHLAVVEDDGNYQHKVSSFYELSLFGESEVVRTYQCSGEIEVFILEKKESVHESPVQSEVGNQGPGQ